MQTAAEAATSKAMEAIRYWSDRGDPMKVRDIRKAMNSGKDIPIELLRIPGSGLEAPPRFGRGSGRDNWITYAKEVSDIDHEVIEAANREELIAQLEALGLIAQEGE